MIGERELKLVLPAASPPLPDGMAARVTYLYADNVAINDGLQQPVQFNLNEAVRLTDSMGADATLWFREMVGSSCVFDYRYAPESMKSER